MTREQATALSKTGWWENADAKTIAAFQLKEKLLCMPFDKFHAAVEEALGRTVWAHEFGMNWNGLQEELQGLREPPTFAEIVGLIPADKVLLVAAD
jgi:hypothetical protein